MQILELSRSCDEYRICLWGEKNVLWIKNGCCELLFDTCGLHASHACKANETKISTRTRAVLLVLDVMFNEILGPGYRFSPAWNWPQTLQLLGFDFHKLPQPIEWKAMNCPQGWRLAGFFKGKGSFLNGILSRIQYRAGARSISAAVKQMGCINVNGLIARCYYPSNLIVF